MIPDETLMRMLTRLQLTAIRDQLANLLDEAARRELTLLDTIHFLCEAEIARKDDRRIQMGLSIAKFPCVRTIDTFDFDARPSIDPRQIRELASGRWVANGDALLLLGPPGVGKTHLAIALGREVIHRGIPCCSPPPRRCSPSFAKAQHANRLEDKLLHFTRPNLLIIDELGYLPLEPDTAHLMFQLVSRRWERGSVHVTSNLTTSEWGNVFGDPVVATAILDRLLHHSHVVTIRGDSYGLREKRKSGLLRPVGSAATAN